MPETVHHRGLDAQGYIEREGSLGLIPHAFRPVVATARDRLIDVFGARQQRVPLRVDPARHRARGPQRSRPAADPARGAHRGGPYGRPLARRGARQGVPADRRGGDAAGRPGTGAERAWRGTTSAGSWPASARRCWARTSPRTCRATGPTRSSPARRTATWRCSSRAGASASPRRGLGGGPAAPRALHVPASRPHRLHPRHAPLERLDERPDGRWPRRSARTTRSGPRPCGRRQSSGTSRRATRASCGRTSTISGPWLAEEYARVHGIKALGRAFSRPEGFPA
jgi:hypothetical protein